MPDTFEDAWRRTRLQLSAVPPLLVREWVQDAYTKAIERHQWAFLRKESSLNILASRSLSVTFTQNSTSATSAALFVASDAGRQIRVTGYPIYTIASVTDASTVVLDRAYAETGGAQTATILDAYTTLPSDFRSFVVIVDRYNQRVLPFWFSEQELAAGDPARTSSDTGPRFLVPQAYSTATATLGQVRYEYWPTPTAARQYPYLYYRGADRLTEASILPGVFGTRSDVLRTGALALASRYPGTKAEPNPYYSLPLARELSGQWEQELQQLILADDNEYPQQYWVLNWIRRYGSVTPTTGLLRSTEADLYDYV